MPLLSLLVAFQTLRRASNFAVSRPAPGVLFAVLRREDKYKARSFIDTFVIIWETKSEPGLILAPLTWPWPDWYFFHGGTAGGDLVWP